MDDPKIKNIITVLGFLELANNINKGCSFVLSLFLFISSHSNVYIVSRF